MMMSDVWAPAWSRRFSSAARGQGDEVSIIGTKQGAWTTVLPSLTLAELGNEYGADICGRHAGGERARRDEPTPHLAERAMPRRRYSSRSCLPLFQINHRLHAVGKFHNNVKEVLDTRVGQRFHQQHTQAVVKGCLWGKDG